MWKRPGKQWCSVIYRTPATLTQLLCFSAGVACSAQEAEQRQRGAVSQSAGERKPSCVAPPSGGFWVPESPQLPEADVSEQPQRLHPQDQHRSHCQAQSRRGAAVPDGGAEEHYGGGHHSSHLLPLSRGTAPAGACGESGQGARVQAPIPALTLTPTPQKKRSLLQIDCQLSFRRLANVKSTLLGQKGELQVWKSVGLVKTQP